MKETTQTFWVVFLMFKGFLTNFEDRFFSHCFFSQAKKENIRLFCKSILEMVVGVRNLREKVE